jgi:branched-chain amino acid transport system ATP-binding protein
MPFLEIDRVDVFISNLQIIRAVSLNAEQGEITSLMGANGAGKSTLLNTISGMLEVRSGEIRFQGRVQKASPRQIVELGIIHVPEGRHLFPYMSVVENLEIGSYLPKAKEVRPDSMEMVFRLFPALEERRDQQAKSLSGGEQQMLAIGRGLMAKPKLLMLDEPSLGLAPLMVRVIFATFKKINEEGTTLLLVEQNVRKSLEVCQRGYVLESGRIVLEGEPKALAENPHVKRAYLGI